MVSLMIGTQCLYCQYILNDRKFKLPMMILIPRNLFVTSLAVPVLVMKQILVCSANNPQNSSLKNFWTILIGFWHFLKDKYLWYSYRGATGHPLDKIHFCAKLQFLHFPKKKTQNHFLLEHPTTVKSPFHCQMTHRFPHQRSHPTQYQRHLLPAQELHRRYITSDRLSEE